MLGPFTRADVARHARGQVEDVLHATGWIYFRRLSLWMDALVILEEAG